MSGIRSLSFALVGLWIFAGAARAEDALRIAVGQRGVYENSISEVGQERGFFRRYGLKLDVLYTQGGGETIQAVTSGSADVGVGVGTLATVGAFAKGAPVRVIGATMKGMYEFWYVPAESPVRSLKDAGGRTVAYSTNGSSTQIAVLTLQREAGVAFKPVATGGPVPTLIQTMSGQVDVGWSAAPIAVEALQEGKIRIVARGADIPAFANQTVRFLVANAGALAAKPDAFRAYLQGYRDTLGWMYSDPGAIKAYAAWAQIPEAVAERSRDEFIPKANADPDAIGGLDAIMRDAVTYKYLPAPLSEAQLQRLIQLQKPLP